MYCDLCPYVLWPLEFQIQKRIVSAETIWGKTVCKAPACWTDCESVRLFIFLSIFVVFADSISYENNEILTRNKCIYKTDYCRIIPQRYLEEWKTAYSPSPFNMLAPCIYGSQYRKEYRITINIYCRILLVQQIISSLKQVWKLSDFKDKQSLSKYFRFR